MIYCLICGKECKNYINLINHIKIHNLKSKEYYDKYYKKKGDGICINCQKETNFIKISSGYSKYCSIKCSKNSNTIKKYKQTCFEKYGVDNPNKLREIKEKKKQTYLKKYGVENPLQSEEVRNKIKQTNLKNYGFNYPIQNEKIKEKVKNTNLKKYDTEYGFQNKKIKEKIKNTNIVKYGIDYLLKPGYIREKIEQTKLEKFTVKITQLLNNLNLELLSDYNQSKKLIKLKCKICNFIFETQYFYIQQGYGNCPNCFPKYKSNGEIELINLIKSIELSEIIENDRTILNGQELDIYIPDKNIAIEFDGLYWHSELFKDKNYHLNKTELCLSKNIQLIHIFEDEWIYKQEIVRSRLKQILNLNNDLPKIHARKCEIKEISPQIKNEFLNKYHIQGEDRSNIKLGAFYNNELVSVMTFSRGSIAKGSKSIECIFELSRFCSNSNYHVPGIASKLLSYFKKNYDWKEIFSYADRRWSKGNIYKKIGFKLSHITKPNYFYIKGINRIHRFNLRKKYDEPKNITERELRLQEGYYRIYDCGHYKFKI